MANYSPGYELGGGGAATEWRADVVLSTMFAGNDFDRYGEVAVGWADSGGGVMTITIDHTASQIRDGIRECALRVGDLDAILAALNLVNTAVILDRAMIERGEYFLEWIITPAAGCAPADDALFGVGMCDNNAAQASILGLIGGIFYQAAGSLNLRASNSDPVTGSGSTVAGALGLAGKAFVSQKLGYQGANALFHSLATVYDTATDSLGDTASKAETWATSATAQPCLFAGYEVGGAVTSVHKWRVEVGARKNPVF